MKRPRPQLRRHAFTLIELLVVIAVISLLGALLLPALARAKESARSVQCLSQMRQIALAVRLYAADHGDEFPRSQHSAFAHWQLPWGQALAPELAPATVSWTNLLQGLYHCPKDLRTSSWSYGQNVYFELSPDSDDYVGSPQTWRRLETVPHPAATILHAENCSAADHIMPHLWAGLQDATDVAATRHKGRSNYNFVDGHATALKLPATYDPARNLDWWNPALAR